MGVEQRSGNRVTTGLSWYAAYNINDHDNPWRE